METQAPLSKTRRKREMHALQTLGERLVALSPSELQSLALPEALLDAVLAAKRMNKFEAIRRQMQYIGKLMRQVDAASIQERLDSWQAASKRSTLWLHSVERWRTRLLEGDSALEELARDYPAADLDRLRALARNARAEKLEGKPPKNFRALFQELARTIPAPAADRTSKK